MWVLIVIIFSLGAGYHTSITEVPFQTEQQCTEAKERLSNIKSHAHNIFVYCFRNRGD